MQHRQQPQKRRAILTEQQAIEIFRIGSDDSTPIVVSSAKVVARRYGINERAVRDIWNQRTWTHATWPIAQSTGPTADKKMGRPIGSKDSSPRRQKLAAATPMSTELAVNLSSFKSNQRPPCFELRQSSGSAGQRGAASAHRLPAPA